MDTTKITILENAGIKWTETLRGTVGNLGIEPMHRCLVEMTEELRAGDLGSAKIRVPELIAAHDTAYDAIEKI